MILAVLQVRMSSTRLPGKVMAPILDKPMLEREIERVNRARMLDHLVIATSGHQSDDPIAAWALDAGVECYRGSRDDVLDRFYQIVKRYAVDHIVRLTGDCPLIDPELIDRLVRFHVEGHYDYSSNVLEPTYPDGFDVEIMTRQALYAAWEEAIKASQREHVTPFINKQPDRFSLGSLKQAMDQSGIRLTVDEAEDLALVREIYRALYPYKPDFPSADIFNLLDKRPELLELNRHYARNEGYQRSLAREEGLMET